MALLVLSLGIIGVVSVAQAGSRQARLAAARGAQLTAAQVLLEEMHAPGSAQPVSGVETVLVGRMAVEVEILVSPLVPGLEEVRATVRRLRSAGPLEVVTRVRRRP
jgi:hypothetical protein